MRHICPVRPLPPENLVDGDRGEVASSDVVADGERRLDVDDEVGESEPKIAQTPKGIPPPPQPSAEEVSRHWLTHLPYRSWCRWCVSAKRCNTPHKKLPAYSREIPLFVADYGFVRDSKDEDLVTCFIGRVYPSRCVISIPCDVKGIDDYAVGRLAHFFESCGLTRMVYMCDQETSMSAMLKDAMKKISGTAEWAGTVPG